MHGTRPSRLRHAHRACEILAQRFGRAHRPRGLAGGRRHFGLRHFLERSLAQLAGRRVPREQHYRRFGSERRVECGYGIGVSRAAGHQRDTHLAGKASPGIRHVDGGSLVPHVHKRQLRVQRSVEYRHDMIAGKREHVARARAREAARDDICTAHCHGYCRMPRAPMSWS